MNFVACRVEGYAGALQLTLQDGARLAAPAAWSMPAGDYLLGLRPEQLRLARPGETPQLELLVDVAAELGADTLLHGRIAGEEIVPRVTSNAGFPHRRTDTRRVGKGSVSHSSTRLSPAP